MGIIPGPLKVVKEDRAIWPYHASAGMPIPASIDTLEDACEYIDRMAGDIGASLRDARKASGINREDLEHLVQLYCLSSDDFISQINRLNVKKSFLWENSRQLGVYDLYKQIRILANSLSRNTRP